MVGSKLGSYVVRRAIGVGGMGTVYAAEHELLGRTAAVKVLLPDFAARPTMRQRFLNEARAAAAVKHPGIVEIYDIGYADDGRAFIAMELLEGETLGQRLARGPLDRVTVYAIAGQIAGALGAAHKKGVVHRDLKPDNVFLVRDAEVADRVRVKLLDFGVAKLLEPAQEALVTKPGSILGTPTYMAPEQCRGVAVDHRADLYALGCIVFAMIARRPPFKGEGMGDILTAHVHLPAPRLSTTADHVPPELDALVDKLLAKAPKDRPQAAGELASVFGRLEREARAADTTAPVLPPAMAAPARATPPLPRLSDSAAPGRPPRPTLPPLPAAPPVPAPARVGASGPAVEASPAPPPPRAVPARAPSAPPVVPAVAARAPTAPPAAPPPTAAPPVALVPAPPVALVARRPSPDVIPPPSGGELPEVTQPTHRLEFPDEDPTLRSPLLAQLVVLADARQREARDAHADEDQVTSPRQRLTADEAAALRAAPPSPPPEPPELGEHRRSASPTTLGGSVMMSEPELAMPRPRWWAVGLATLAVGTSVALIAAAIGRNLRGKRASPQSVTARQRQAADLADAPLDARAPLVPETAEVPLAAPAGTAGLEDATPELDMADQLVPAYITSTPTGARIADEHGPIGVTPFRGDVPRGGRLTLRLDGYHSADSEPVTGASFEWHPTLGRKPEASGGPLPAEAGLGGSEAIVTAGTAPLAAARTAAKTSQWAVALAAAERALKDAPAAADALHAHTIAALAACNLGKGAVATAHLAVLPSGRAAGIVQVCLKHGVTVAPPAAPTSPTPPTSPVAPPARPPAQTSPPPGEPTMPWL